MNPEKSSLKIEMKKINFIIFSIIIASIFIVGVDFTFAQNNATTKANAITTSTEKYDNINKKLLEVANIKLEIANEKEAAYDKAINQLKIYVSFFGSLLILVAIIFGLYKDKKIVQAKDELLNAIEEKKKSLEEANSINMDKKMFELEKNNIIKIDEIKKMSLGNIDDLQTRIKKLENNIKIDSKNGNTEKNNEEEIPFAEKNPYE